MLPPLTPPDHPHWSRRQFLRQTGLGAGTLALSSLLHADALNSAHAAGTSKDGGTSLAGAPGPHFAGTAKSVIFLFMSGGPSHVDTFDPKPDLAKLAGKDVPESLARLVPKIQRSGLKNLMASHWAFKNHGQSGIPVSELLPHTARHVDDLCIIRSMSHRNPVHGPGECVALTGTGAGDRPSIGAWSLYGLGSMNQNLPAFITMNLHTDGMQYPQAAGWGPGFLPSRFQGTVVDPAKGIRHVDMPNGISNSRRREQLDLIEWFNRRHLDQVVKNTELEARIRSYEMAFRLQTAAPELFDLKGESEATKKLYGLDQDPTRTTAHGCLLARRMVERGVRYVQVRVGGWDAHGNIKANHTKMAARTDQPIAALLSDLKARGLLDSTLVVWGGEFGRTPTMEGRGNGRDHSPAGYTTWLAGGGVKGGHIHGQTDPIGYVAVKDPVTPPDFHATLLHALGLNANELKFEHHGLEETPTVFGGKPFSSLFS